jgi:hypothetical protein
MAGLFLFPWLVILPAVKLAVRDPFGLPERGISGSKGKKEEYF